jgi:hypothetical protein
MRQIVLTLWVCLIASSCLAQPSQGTLDQSFTGPYGGYWLSYTGMDAVAQVYTAGITGNLTSVKLSVVSSNATPIVVLVLDATTPDSTPWPILGYTTYTPPLEIPCTTVPTCELVPVPFSKPIPQVAGKPYAIAVFPLYSGQIWFGATGSTKYSGGQTYAKGPWWIDITLIYPGLASWQQISSFYFQTYVKPVRGK